MGVRNQDYTVIIQPQENPIGCSLCAGLYLELGWSWGTHGRGRHVKQEISPHFSASIRVVTVLGEPHGQQRLSPEPHARLAGAFPAGITFTFPQSPACFLADPPSKSQACSAPQPDLLPMVGFPRPASLPVLTWGRPVLPRWDRAWHGGRRNVEEGAAKLGWA